jgi:hypothetical protein
MESTLFTTLTVNEEASLSGGGHHPKKKDTPKVVPTFNTIIQNSVQVAIILGGSNNKIKQDNEQVAAIVGSKASSNKIVQNSSQTAVIVGG